MPAELPTKEKPSMESAVQSEIQEAQKRVANAPKVTGDLSSFAKQFTATPNPDGTFTKESDKPKGDEGLKADPEDGEIGNQPPINKPSLPSEKKPSYIKTLEADKERLAKELETEKARLSKEVQDLTEQLSKAKKPDEINTLLAERDAAIKERQENEEKLRVENERLKSRVSLIDMTEDPIFVEKYIAPIESSSKKVMEIVNASGRADLKDMITQVATLNAAIQSAKSDEDAVRFRNQRDELVSNLGAELPRYQQRIFDTVITDLFQATENHAEALRNHAVTAKQIREQARERGEEARRKVSEQWGSAFKQVSENLEREAAIPENVKTFMDSNAITADTADDESIATSAITDGAQGYEPKEVARILKQGALFKRQSAVITALQKMLNEKDQTIAKLKGSGTRGEDTHGGGSLRDGEKEAKSFFGKFAKPA